MYCRVLNLMSADVSEVRATSIIKALRTRQYIPEDYELQILKERRFEEAPNY
jgi:hypothetical protein